MIAGNLCAFLTIVVSLSSWTPLTVNSAAGNPNYHLTPVDRRIISAITPVETFKAQAITISSAEDLENTLTEIKSFYLEEPARADSMLRAVLKASERLNHSEGIVEYYTMQTELYLLKDDPQDLIDEIDLRLSQRDSSTEFTPLQKLSLKMNKAILLSNNLQDEEALKILDEIESASDAPSLLAPVYATLGNIYNRQGNYDKALKNYLQSVDYYYSEGYTENYVTVLINIADVLALTNRLDEAMEYLQRAQLELSPSMTDTRAEFNLYNNLGAVYRTKGDHERARQSYIKALDIANKLQYQRFEAVILLNLANLYMETGDFELSLDHYQKSMKLSRERNLPYGIFLNWVNIAKLYESNNLYSMAITASDSALAYSELLDYKPEKNILLKNLSELYDSIGETNKAFAFLKQHLELNEELFSLDWVSGMFRTEKTTI